MPAYLPPKLPANMPPNLSQSTNVASRGSVSARYQRGSVSAACVPSPPTEHTGDSASSVCTPAEHTGPEIGRGGCGAFQRGPGSWKPAANSTTSISLSWLRPRAPAGNAE
eukprot:scaffold1728_cov53-Phaeocystis_antarctica.AAC.4